MRWRPARSKALRVWCKGVMCVEPHIKLSFLDAWYPGVEHDGTVPPKRAEAIDWQLPWRHLQASFVCTIGMCLMVGMSCFEVPKIQRGLR